MSMAVIVLSQSRTSRYALLAVLAAAAFDGVRRALCRRNAAAGLLAAVLAGVVVLGGGYWGADRMTRAAIAHYNQLAYDAALRSGAGRAGGNAGRGERRRNDGGSASRGEHRRNDGGRAG